MSESPAWTEGPDRDIERITTGNSQADRVLGGGFPINSINVIMGEPGTGKTVFAEQLVFHNAGKGDDDRPCLYLTTLSEPLAKVVKYLQGFDFFDENLLGSAVIYDEVGTELAAEGPDALVTRLKALVKEHRPRIIVVDSFKALHDISGDMAKMRLVAHDLAGLLTAYDTTAFLVGEYSPEQVATFPEFVVADGIVELLRRETGMRDERYFRVRKLRGSFYREGQHAVRLSRGGVEIFRRLVSPEAPPRYAIPDERISTGVAGLDEMIDGGLRVGTTTLLGGPTGAGKTTVGLQFILEGLRHGEPGLYVHLEENPTQLEHLVREFGADPEDPNLHLLYRSPVELQIDSLVDAAFRIIRQAGIRRVVFDAVGDLATAAGDARRLHDYLYSLAQHFAAAGITAVFAFETARPGLTGSYSIDAPFSHLSDNILLLEVRVEEEQTRRVLRVIKTRGSDHDPRTREVHISASGIRLEG